MHERIIVSLSIMHRSTDLDEDEEEELESEGDGAKVHIELVAHETLLH